MKQVYNYWMPDTDNHFHRMITKRIRQGGPAEYQDDVRDAAYQFVTDFNIAIDVGANVGLWAKPLTEKFNRVIAFEPLEQVNTCLEKNVAGLNVEINKFALSSTNGTVDMVYDSVNTGSSYVVENSAGSIEIKTLDSLDLPKFGLLKVDCERHDLEVLKGGEATLLKYKPIIVVEQHPDTDYCAGAYLKSLGAIELAQVRKDFVFGW